MKSGEWSAEGLGAGKRLMTQMRFLKNLSETNTESNPRRGTANHEWTRMNTNNRIDGLSFLQNSQWGMLAWRQTRGSAYFNIGCDLGKMQKRLGDACR